MLRDGTYIPCKFGSIGSDAKLLHLPNRDIWISLLLISSVKRVSHRHINNVDKLHKSFNTLYFDFVFLKRRAILRRIKLYRWGGVTVVLIVVVAEAMPDSSSEAIDFVHSACLSLVALGPSFVLKKMWLYGCFSIVFLLG